MKMVRTKLTKKEMTGMAKKEGLQLSEEAKSNLHSVDRARDDKIKALEFAFDITKAMGRTNIKKTCVEVGLMIIDYCDGLETYDPSGKRMTKKAITETIHNIKLSKGKTARSSKKSIDILNLMEAGVAEKTIELASIIMQFDRKSTLQDKYIIPIRDRLDECLDSQPDAE